MTSHIAEAAEAVPIAPAGPPPAEVLSPREAVARGRLATWAAAGAFGAFMAIFGLVRARRSDAFDLALLLKFQRRRNPLLAALMRIGSWFGFPPQSRIIPPLLVGGLWLARLRLEAAALTAGWGTALVSTLLKALMRRPRPIAGEDLRVVAAPLGGSSFPSGHVITYMGFYGFAAYLAFTLIRPAAVRRAVVAGLLALLALVGPSRIHQGHHWPTDVTASYLLGTTYLIGLTTLYRRAKARRSGLAP
jgi:undecaprenyl-diphosphatase